MPMNVLPRSIERGSVTLFSASVVLIFLRFQGTQNLGLYTYCSLSEQSVILPCDYIPTNIYMYLATNCNGCSSGQYHVLEKVRHKHVCVYLQSRFSSQS